MQFIHKILRFVLLLLIGIFLLSPNINAKQLGGHAGHFLRMGLGADRVAMGGVGVAMASSGANWYYNPAAVPYQTSKTAILSYRKLSFDRSLMYAGISMPLQPEMRKLRAEHNVRQTKAGLAFGILRAGTTDNEGRDSNGELYEIFTWSDNLFHGTFSLMPFDMVSIGVSIKWMMNAVPKVKEDDKTLFSNGLGVDLGMQVVPLSNLRFGLQIRDLGSKISWESGDVWGDDSGDKEDALPTQIRIGAAWDPIQHLTIASDIVTYPEIIGDDDDAFQPLFGVEYRRPYFNNNQMAFRAGYQGFAPTFGFGLDLMVRHVNVALDYAFLLEPESAEGVHILTWIFGF